MPPTKFAVVLRDDLLAWQKLNITAFLTTGIAHAHPSIVGERYEDASGHGYHALSGHPILVLTTTGERLRTIARRARSRDVTTALFIDDMFETFDDVANRATVARYEADALPIAGMALLAERRTVDKITKGASMHP